MSGKTSESWRPNVPASGSGLGASRRRCGGNLVLANLQMALGVQQQQDSARVTLDEHDV
jgi:hypothetical protein